MKARLCFSVCLFFFVAAIVTAQEVTLARDGRPLFQVSLREDAEEIERWAAEDLETWLRQMAGATEAPAEGATVRIEIGATDPAAVAEALAGLGPSGCVIHVEPGHIVLTGPTPRGTANAVYTLLSDLGVHHYLAPPIFLHVPRCDSVSVPVGTRRYDPQFAGR